MMPLGIHLRFFRTSDGFACLSEFHGYVVVISIVDGETYECTAVDVIVLSSDISDALEHPVKFLTLLVQRTIQSLSRMEMFPIVNESRKEWAMSVAM
jgi:hypothetical protein